MRSALEAEALWLKLDGTSALNALVAASDGSVDGATMKPSVSGFVGVQSRLHGMAPWSFRTTSGWGTSAPPRRGKQELWWAKRKQRPHDGVESRIADLPPGLP